MKEGLRVLPLFLCACTSTVGLFPRESSFISLLWFLLMLLFSHVHALGN